METDFSRALRRAPLILALTAPALAADPFGALEAVPPISGLQAAPAPCPPADLASALELAEVVDQVLIAAPDRRVDVDVPESGQVGGLGGHRTPPRTVGSPVLATASRTSLLSLSSASR